MSIPLDKHTPGVRPSGKQPQTRPKQGDTMIKYPCSAIGPRGGQCRRNAQVANGWPLDFCTSHNQQVRDGKSVHCARCDGTVATS